MCSEGLGGLGGHERRRGGRDEGSCGGGGGACSKLRTVSVQVLAEESKGVSSDGGDRVGMVGVMHDTIAASHGWV